MDSRKAFKGFVRTVVASVMGMATYAALPADAEAFCIYNAGDQTINAKVLQGNFNVNIAPGGNACCHYSDTSCNPTGSQTALVTAQIEFGKFNCTVGMQGGGYTHLFREDRTQLGLPPDYNCVAADWNHAVRDYSNYYSVAPSTTRDVRFLVTGDPQYDNNGDSANADPSWKATPDATLARMLQTMSDRRNRGVLIAGDLTMNAIDEEIDFYWSAIDGWSRFVYDGVGNHDYAENDFLRAFGQKDARDLRNEIRDRKRSTALTNWSGDGSDGDMQHYSWDWSDVHVVQLNYFASDSPLPGDESQDSTYNALHWLELDLANAVGHSNRPVVLVHHVGFDDFGKSWSGDAQRRAYWDAIAPYNVVGIFAGHNHLTPPAATQNWAIPWYRPTGKVNGPDSIPTFVTGAALYGAFTKVVIGQNTMQVTRTNSDGVDKGTVTYPLRTRAALNFRNTSTTRGTSYDWDPSYGKATCAQGEAISGLSAATGLSTGATGIGGSTSTADAYGVSALCKPMPTASLPNRFPGRAEEPWASTRVVELHGSNQPDPHLDQDWDPSHYKLECARDEYVIGVSENAQQNQGNNRFHGIRCVKGNWSPDMPMTCTPRAFNPGDNAPMASHQDWDPGKYKVECGWDEFAVGVSVASPYTSLPLHAPHALLCCRLD